MALREYIKKNVMIDFIYCRSNDPNNQYRKPNTGMLSEIIKRYRCGLQGIPKSDMLMIGDASGRPGDFSDSDLQAAINFGIEYLDVDDIQDVYRVS